jgi:hypothetical protein
MLKSHKTPLLWSLALGGALLVGCKDDKSGGTGSTGGPATRPTTGPSMPMPRPPTTQPGEGAMMPGAPGTTGTPDVTATPGTPAVPRLPGLPRAGDAEPAGGRVGPATRPTSLPGGTPLVVPDAPRGPGGTAPDNK